MLTIGISMESLQRSNEENTAGSELALQGHLKTEYLSLSVRRIR